jgi:predicted enzyme related to lactoylglutathione lyase
MLSTRFVTGSPNWIDLATPSTEEAVAFYSGVFGWTFVPGPPEFGGYGEFTLDGKEIGGAMGGIAGVEPFWSVYFQSADIDSTAKAVEGAGGSVSNGPDDVGTLGRMAGFTDRAGARFCSWQRRDHQGLGVVNEAGAFCWAELYTPDVPAAAAFYHAVYGWETEAVPYPGGTYTMASPSGGGQEASFGGLIPIEPAPAAAASGAYWLPYFEVADTDEAVTAARRLGGGVSTEPVTIEGVGRVAKLTDPHGARFAVIKSEAA